MEFIAQTEPAVNIPSKNIHGNVLISKNLFVNPPKHSERKNPTHVDVQRVQLIRSPKNFDILLIKFLVPSKIDPQTNMEVIP
jgi:hypothetical protein